MLRPLRAHHGRSGLSDQEVAMSILIPTPPQGAS